MKDFTPYTILKDKHLGETAFVFGAGPSLYFDYVKNERFAFPHKYVTLTANSGIMFMPWQEGSASKRYWISNDSLCRKWGYWNKVKTAKAIKIVRDSWSKYADELTDFLYFSPRPTSEGKINPEDTGLAYCSSIPSGVDLCLQMGCKTIYLIGVDHYMYEGKSHAWQFLPDSEWPKGWLPLLAPQSQQKEVFFNYNNLAFNALKKFADYKEAKIINCNPKSKVEYFEKQPLEKVLERHGLG